MATFSKFFFDDTTGPTAPPFLPAPLHPTPSTPSKNTRGAAPAIWEVAVGPGSPCPVEGALEHLSAPRTAPWCWGWAWQVGGAGGRGQPLALAQLPPACATMELDAGRGQAEGLPHSAMGCQGGLEGAGKEPG